MFNIDNLILNYLHGDNMGILDKTRGATRKGLDKTKDAGGGP